MVLCRWGTRMKRFALILSLLSLAGVGFSNSPPLDEVNFQLSSKAWVSTKSTLVSVNINATLSGSDLVKARAEILDKLNKIAAGDWHITQFERTQDTSGLEKLFVEAQARITDADLTNVYQNAKTVSKPGATYTINALTSPTPPLPLVVRFRFSS